MNPKISIIVPVYNVERYIKECLDSILSSTFSDFELLLVDDGSPDKSGAICDEYGKRDSRIRVFHKPNGGVSSARNLGLDNACGEWVTFIDSDDLITLTFIEGLYNPIANGEDVDFVQGGCSNYGYGQPTTINRQFEDYVGDETLYILKKIEGYCFSKLFKTAIVNGKNTIRFDTRMKVCEDMAFTYDYLHNVRRIASVSETGYYYRCDNELSAMHSHILLDNYEFGIKNYNILMDKYDSLLATYKLSYADLPYQSEHKATHLMNLVSALYKNGMNRRERLMHIKNDLTERDSDILSFFKTGGHSRQFRARVLRSGKYIIFDILTKTFSLAWNWK